MFPNLTLLRVPSRIAQPALLRRAMPPVATPLLLPSRRRRPCTLPHRRRHTPLRRPRRPTLPHRRRRPVTRRTGLQFPVPPRRRRQRTVTHRHLRRRVEVTPLVGVPVMATRPTHPRHHRRMLQAPDLVVPCRIFHKPWTVLHRLSHRHLRPMHRPRK